jgi:microcystin-dependent protein
MAKLESKAITKLFATEEINADLQPTPLGAWASGGAVTISYDPEVLLDKVAEGLTTMTLQSGTSNIILPPGGDMAALEYSTMYFIKSIQQSGIAEYSAIQDYHINDLTKAPSGFVIYRSLINENIGNPLSDSTKWEALDLLALRQATISQRGTLQIATISDINTGTDNTKALTVANLRASNINFTGNPTAPTQAINDNSTRIATTKLVNDKINEMMVGEIKTYARQNFNDFATNGGTGTWLYCDGRTLSTSTYPKLFAVLGYFYGGSGANFNIPDLRGKVIAGASSGEPINKTEGAKTHSLTQPELPSYNLVYNVGTYLNPARSAGAEMTFSKVVGNQNMLIPSGGGNQPHNNMQPTIYLPYFIYAI